MHHCRVDFMALAIKHLRKVYQDGNVALDDFNLELGSGVFGLLGPNGAGKSTLLEILSLNLMPTSGRVKWEGRDIHQHPTAFRRVLGYLPQTYGFYDELRAQTFLEYMGRLFGLRGRGLRARVTECVDLVNLREFRRRRIKGFSGGMRQRLAIAQALVGRPKLLVIDEPTTGLDPAERVAFRNMIFDLGRECVVFLSTHIVKDVEFSCHGMTVLFGGTQRFTGRPAEFMRRIEGRVFEVEMAFEVFSAFAAAHHVVSIQQTGDRVNVRFIEREARSAVEGARPVGVNLEDAYVDFIREREEELGIGAGAVA
jgi:ABC-type multidrug transport system ATPase subunit